MNIIKDLVEILPQFIIYIVTGYVFIKTFHFVALKQNTLNIEHILTASLVIGYVYCNIAYLIPFSISHKTDTILIILSALVLGYIVGRIVQQKFLIRILDFLKIRDTGNRYFWDDIMDCDYPMKVIVSYNNIIYEGMLHNYESYSNEPHIVLSSYIEKNSDGQTINDYSNDTTKIIILKTSEATGVNITYYKESAECEDLKDLCKFNARFKEQEKE